MRSVTLIISFYLLNAFRDARNEDSLILHYGLRSFFSHVHTFRSACLALDGSFYISIAELSNITIGHELYSYSVYLALVAKRKL